MDLCYIVDGISAKRKKTDAKPLRSGLEPEPAKEVKRDKTETQTAHDVSGPIVKSLSTSSSQLPADSVSPLNEKSIKVAPSALAGNPKPANINLAVNSESIAVTSNSPIAETQAQQDKQQQTHEQSDNQQPTLPQECLNDNQLHQPQAQQQPTPTKRPQQEEQQQQQQQQQQHSHQHHSPVDIYPRVPLEPKVQRMRPPPIAIPPLPHRRGLLDSMGSPSMNQGHVQWSARSKNYPVVAHSGYVAGSAFVNQNVLFHPDGTLSPPSLPLPVLLAGTSQAHALRPYSSSPHETAPIGAPDPNQAAVAQAGAKPLPQVSNERILVLEKKLSPQSGVTTKTRQYSCNHCGRSFYRRSDLARHIQIHLGIKPNLCPFCGKAFIQRSALTVHVRVHTGEKPYNCQVCGRLFSDSSSLARHRRIHLRQQGEGQLPSSSNALQGNNGRVSPRHQGQCPTDSSDNNTSRSSP